MKDEGFICPACGADVPAKAKSCPECGSDERTGWSENTIYDGTGIEEPREFDYDEWKQRESGHVQQRSGREWLWWMVGLITLALFVWLVLR